MVVPKIIDVKTKSPLLLDVTFENGDIKELDLKQYVEEFAQFRELENPNLFSRAHVDVGGMGIVWKERIDLSRYDIWSLGIDI